MPKAEQALAERIRLSLSWREKARRLEHGARDNERLRAFYGTQAVNAESALAQQRAEGRDLIAAAGARLQGLLAAKAAAHRVDRCRASVETLNRMLRVESPAELGGFVDLPLEGYAAAIHAPQQADDPWAVFTPRGLLVVIASVAVGVALVFAYAAARDGGVNLFIVHPGTPGAPIPVIVANDGHGEISLVLPRPETPGPGYYIDVLARRDGEAGFVRLPPAPGAWDYPASASSIQEPIALPAGLRAELTFRTDALAAVWAGSIRALRFELRQGNGALLATRDLRWQAEVGVVVRPPAIGLPDPNAR